MSQPLSDADKARRSFELGHERDNSNDDRSESRRDHDRIFYSAEFARLEGITQVATVTSNTIHNRLTHSYRVEQVARSIVGRLVTRDHVAVDEDVVAAAALGHDIGHSPFGHTGELALQRALLCEFHFNEKDARNFDGRQCGYEARCTPGRPCILPDSFEGNAQSFRILTVLAPKKLPYKPWGLDLTRATLRAGLKYPWVKGERPDKPDKWGAYDSDLETLRWVLNVDGLIGPKALEAQIMDTADDIAYAVHDLEDFYKAGVIPVGEIRVGSVVFEEFLQYITADPNRASNPRLRHLADVYAAAKRRPYPIEEAERTSTSADDAASDAQLGAPNGEAVITGDNVVDPNSVYRDVPELLDIDTRLKRLPSGSYRDDVRGRAELTRMRSNLISTFVGDLGVEDSTLRFRTSTVETFMDFLKQLTWYYVINDPELRSVHSGQEKAILLCFAELHQLATDDLIEQLPGGLERIRRLEGVRTLYPRLLDYVRLGRDQKSRYTPRQVVSRAVVDFICSLTDAELYALAARFSGAASHALPTSLSALRGGY